MVIELPPFRLGQVMLEITLDTVVAVGPPGAAEPRNFACTAEELRDFLRTDDAGRYRPLPGAMTMRSNWQASVTGTLAEITEAIYPLAGEHTAQADDGTLRLVSLEEVLARQTGRYQVAAKLDGQGREVAAKVLCGQCVKQPLWRGEVWDGQSLPCPEPCSVMVSLCREAALWQASPPAPRRPDPALAYANFEEPGNEIRETYLRARYGDQANG